MSQEAERVQLMHFIVTVGDGRIGFVDYYVHIQPIDTRPLTGVFIQYIITSITKVPIEWVSTYFS